MTDITVTAASVRPLPGATVEKFIVGSALTVGQSVYVAADGYVDPADGNADSVSPYAIGVAVSVINGATNGATTAASGDTVEVVTLGPVTGFSGMTPGDVLYQSDTAGKLADSVGSTAHKIGKARSATVVFINPATEGYNG